MKFIVWNNVRRNARAYLAYFLSSSFAVMIFFTYAIFIFHPDLENSALGEMVKLGMQAADYVIFLCKYLGILKNRSGGSRCSFTNRFEPRFWAIVDL
jgi:hypothetical protein